MPWQFLLGINLLCGVIRETLNKRISQKTDPFVSILYLFTIDGLFFLILQLFLFGLTFHFNIITIFTGILITFGYIAYYFAVRISLTQSILFGSYSLLITIFLAALFLGESRYFDLTTPTGLKVILGVGIACVALWYLLHEGRKAEVQLEKKWFTFIGMNIVMMGIGSFGSVYALREFHLTTYEVLLNQTIGGLPVVFAWIIYTRKKMKIASSTLRDILINSVVTAGAVIAFFELLKVMPSAKIYPIQTVLLIILTMISGVMLYKEGNILKGKRIFGVLFGLVGIILLSSV